MHLFSILLGFLIFVFVILFGAFLIVVLSDILVPSNWSDCISKLVGLSEKNKVLTFLGVGMGGVLIALQALASHRRAKKTPLSTWDISRSPYG